MNSRRLRGQVGDIGRVLADASEGGSWKAGIEAELLTAVDGFKQLLLEADGEALKHDGVLPEASAAKIDSTFRELCLLAHAHIGDAAPQSALLKDALGQRLQREFLPYLLLTRTAERFYSKPRGYAGDFLTIDIIYANQPTGTGRVAAMRSLSHSHPQIGNAFERCAASTNVGCTCLPLSHRQSRRKLSPNTGCSRTNTNAFRKFSGDILILLNWASSQLGCRGSVLTIDYFRRGGLL